MAVGVAAAAFDCSLAAAAFAFEQGLYPNRLQIDPLNSQIVICPLKGSQNQSGTFFPLCSPGMYMTLCYESLFEQGTFHGLYAKPRSTCLFATWQPFLIAGARFVVYIQPVFPVIW